MSSATLTQLPGFYDPIHQAQKTFRTLLTALSRPGEPQKIELVLDPPGELHLATAAACLTLLDLETVVWLQPEFSPKVAQWLLFHTGCCFTSKPNEADFALIEAVDLLPELTSFNLGTGEEPETSTTLLVQMRASAKTSAVVISGPGHPGAYCTQMPQLPEKFLQQWQQNVQSYPLGVDAFFLQGQTATGLPRTARLQSAS